MSFPKGANWVPVQALAKCNRCGAEGLAWQLGASGKHYLCEARQRADGAFEANRRAFHVCTASGFESRPAASRMPPSPSAAQPPPTAAAPIPIRPDLIQALADLTLAVRALTSAVLTNRATSTSAPALGQGRWGNRPDRSSGAPARSCEVIDDPYV